MKRDILQKLIENAKTKKDGIFKCDGYYYVVKHSTVMFIGQINASGCDCKVWSFTYGFLVELEEVKCTAQLKKQLQTLMYSL